MVVIHKKHKETADEKEIRQLKEQEEALGVQDQYQARGFELVSWVQEHKGIVIGLIALVVLAGAAYSGYLYWDSRRSEEASSAFMAAVKEYEALENDATADAEKRKAIQTRFMDVAKSFAASDVARMANIYAGHLALANNDAPLAVSLYQAAGAKLSKSSPVYSLSLIGLGYAQEKNGDNQGALASFESIVHEKNIAGADLALWEAARLAQLNKEHDKAVKYLDRLLEDYPSSVYEKNAKKLKAELGK